MTHKHPLARNLLSVAIAATSVALPSSFVLADTNAPAALEELIVNARRDAENVQDVPLSLQVVDRNAIQNMAMTNPTELSKLAPGLKLTLSDPTNPVVILRGVRWTAGSGTAAIPFYMNEINFDTSPILQTMYDIEQVEVLRGPQGTNRGAPSISGAVTISTVKPDVNGVGGYVSGLMGENEHGNLQGAINMPIIEGKLAARLSVNAEHTDGGGIKSVNSSKDPGLDLHSERLGLRFEPTDELTADFMYQRMNIKADLFHQVVGDGYAGAFGPANYNGPALSASDRRGVQEIPDLLDYRVDLMTFNLNWEVLGHELSYSYGSQVQDGDSSDKSQDPFNAVVGYDSRLTTRAHPAHSDYHIHELRLSSIRGGDRWIDYDVGYYNAGQDGTLTVDQETLVFGALGPRISDGAGGVIDLGPSSPYANAAQLARYTLPIHQDIRLRTINWSAYGNVNLHLTDDTELALGLREIHDNRPVDVSVKVGPGFALAAPASAFGGACLPGFGFPDSPVYPGFCDADASQTQHYPSREEQKALIYNATLSHKISPDLMVYGTTGTSWRAGLPSIANPGLPNDLLNPGPEEATSYELGFKSTWMDTVRVNADIFQIDYSNQLTQFRGIQYWNNTGSGQVSTTGEAFYRGVDSQVRGIEMDITARPMTELTVGANISYADIQSTGGDIPCNTGPAISSTNAVNTCKAPKDLNAAPKFQANLTANYEIPLGSLDGYVRGVVNYQDKSTASGSSITTPSYTLVDLFVGVRGGEDGGWDVGLYAKNVFDKLVTLSQNKESTPVGADDYFGYSGYDFATVNPPREVGISARYSFGSK